MLRRARRLGIPEEVLGVTKEATEALGAEAIPDLEPSALDEGKPPVVAVVVAPGAVLQDRLAWGEPGIGAPEDDAEGSVAVGGLQRVDAGLGLDGRPELRLRA